MAAAATAAASRAAASIEGDGRQRRGEAGGGREGGGDEGGGDEDGGGIEDVGVEGGGCDEGGLEDEQVGPGTHCGPPRAPAAAAQGAACRTNDARSRAYLMYASSSLASWCSCVADTSLASPAQLGTAAEYAAAAAHRSEPRGKEGCMHERGPRRMRARGN